MTMNWNRCSVLQKVSELPYIEDEMEWRKAYVVPVEEFGLALNHAPTISDPATWVFNLVSPVLVAVEKITSTWQSEGIRLDALAWYLEHRLELFDPEGWFDNDYPVLIARPDGTFTIRDGNHRIIADKLNGVRVVLAYVVKGL